MVVFDVEDIPTARVYALRGGINKRYHHDDERCKLNDARQDVACWIRYHR